MLYFSEIKSKKVTANGGTYVGKLVDLVFRASEQPIVTKCVIAHGHNRIVIPTTFLKTITPTITIDPNYLEATFEENELSLQDHLLDQQIIDINGNKVVRVNDVVIQDKPVLMIAGVDIGLLGVLRWLPGQIELGNALRFVGFKPKSEFLSWTDIQPLELASGKVVLKHEEEKLERLLPEDLADHLEKMNVENVVHILEALDEEQAAVTIASLNVAFQSSLFKKFPSAKCAKILELIDPDDAVDIILTLTEKRRDQILSVLPTEKQTELRQLLSLSRTPIGELLTTEFVTTAPEDTIRKVRQYIKDHTKEISALFYVYVVNKSGQLVGVVSLHELMVQEADTPIYKCMIPSVVVIHLETPVEIAVKKMLKYKLVGLPVMNQKKEIVGVVAFDDVAEAIRGQF